MNPVEHFLIGWCVASTSSELNTRERLMITAAAVIPDIDGLGMLVEIPTRDTDHPILWWTDYHHILTHNIASAAVVTLIAFAFAKNRWLTALLACVSFHTHILGDVIGARGPDGFQWPIPYLLPFSRTPELLWEGQWALNAWQNMAITAGALLVTFYLAWKRGYSPLSMFWQRGDQEFVRALRMRFGSVDAAA